MMRLFLNFVAISFLCSVTLFGATASSVTVTGGTNMNVGSLVTSNLTALKIPMANSSKKLVDSPIAISDDTNVVITNIVATKVTIGTGGFTSDLGTTVSEADDTYYGLTRSGLNNSGGVTQWDAVYLNGSSAWVKADADGSGTYPARGIAVATAADGVATVVLTRGTIRNDAWTWTPGGTIYLSTTTGTMTQTVPSSEGDKIQILGYALNADTMAVEISPDYGTAPAP